MASPFDNFAAKDMTVQSNPYASPYGNTTGEFGLSAKQPEKSKLGTIGGALGATGGAVAMAVLGSNPVGWITAGLITLGGSLLSAFTHKDRKLTPEEKYYNTLQRVYSRAGSRAKLRNTVTNMVAAK